MVNRKDDSSEVPYDYSFCTSRFEFSAPKNNNGDIDPLCKFVTPPHVANRTRNVVNKGSDKLMELMPMNEEKQLQCNGKLRNEDDMEFKAVCVNLNTEHFFDEFDTKFVVDFGNTPTKDPPNPSLKQTVETCPEAAKTSSRISSRISESLKGASSIEAADQLNEEDLSCPPNATIIQPEMLCGDAVGKSLKENRCQREPEWDK
jgi:hypothetical protein